MKELDEDDEEPEFAQVRVRSKFLHELKRKKAEQVLDGKVDPDITIGDFLDYCIFGKGGQK